jgi:hypothetical protein
MTKVVSLETRRKLSVAMKNQSTESKENRAKALRGKKRTIEQRKRMSLARLKLKIKLSPEEIANRTEVRRKNGWNKNPEETKRRMSLNNARANLGKKFSKETNKRKGLKKEKNPAWRGGITTEFELIRKSLEYKLWRQSIFERDNFTCQKYGTIGGKLIAHHINNFAEKEELRLAINNGITLSKKAHQEFHRKYGIKNNTKEQLEEFLYV